MTAATTNTSSTYEAADGGAAEGGDYALRSHEVIASRTSLYEVLETLGKCVNV